MKLPILHIDFPRSITALHQIEITSRCDLRCSYCPSPNLGRPKVDMERAIFVRSLEWAATFFQKGTQVELNLAGIGESTLHPEFVEFLRITRQALGDDVRLIFATNGIQIAKRGMEFVRAMATYRPRVWVSLHRPERAGLAIDFLRRYELLEGVSADPSVNANDWAGQVTWPQTPGNAIPCPWLREGKVMAMADGRLTSCCLDASGIGVIGHVNDPIGEPRTKPYALCRSCYQHVGVAGYDQFGASP